MIARLIKGFIRIFSDALREHEPAVSHAREAEHQHQARHQAILDLLNAEIKRRIASDAEDQRLQKRELRLDRITLFVSVLTLFAVGYYAVIARHQRDEMRKQVTEMRESNRLTREAQEQTGLVVAADNRAWLGVERVEETQFGVGQVYRAKALIRNMGNTPAVSIGTRMALFFSKIPTDKDRIEIPASSRGFLTAIPKTDFMLPVESTNGITEELADTIRNSRTAILVVGHITYTDRFGSKGKTTFCVYRDFIRGGFTHCQTGNSAE